MEGLRVVELDGDIATCYAGRLLADLGGQVNRIVVKDRVDPVQRSNASSEAGSFATPGALFAVLNHGKDVTYVESSSELAAPEVREMVSASDIVLAGRRILSDQDVLEIQQSNPRAVVGLASTCGESWGGRQWLHLHAVAMSGVSSLIGRPDRMPLPPPFDIGLYQSGVNLAGAVLAAHFRAQEQGLGQVVQVDAAGALFSFMWSALAISFVARQPFVRSGRRFPGSGGAYPFALFPCADGYVACIGRTESDWQTLLRMMGEPEWSKDVRFQDPVEIARHFASEADSHVTPWFEERSRDELFRLAQDAGLPLAPVKRASEVLEDAQFNFRNSFGPEIPVGNKKVRVLQYPYQYFRADMRVRDEPRPDATVSASAAHRTPAVSTGRSPKKGLFAGLRVLDLGWVWSGPMVSSALADLGADVIKLENPLRLDNARLRGRPVRDGKPVEGPLSEISPTFHQWNRGKRSMLLDIKDPAGADMFRRLVRVSDVIIENLTPGVFDRAGVGYNDVVTENPGLIWMAASSVGLSGPLVGLRAYAPIMSSLAGIESLVGYEDDPVVGMLGCGLGDANSGSHALFAVLAALIGRQRDGKGRFIDMSQTETAAAILVEPLIEAQLRNEDPPPMSATHPDVAPHGHYQCAGEDQWVALAAIDDAMWIRLATEVGGPQLADDERFATATRRLSRRVEIDDVLTKWTCRRAREVIVTRMAAIDVAAVPVFSVDEARGMFGGYIENVAHPITGDEELTTVPWMFRDTPRTVSRPAPLVGEHTEEILRDVVGCDEEETKRYIKAFDHAM